MFFVIFFRPRGIPNALIVMKLELYSQCSFSHRFNPQLIFITLGRVITPETCIIIYAKVNSKDISVYKQYSSPRRCINCRIQINEKVHEICNSELFCILKASLDDSTDTYLRGAGFITSATGNNKSII